MTHVRLRLDTGYVSAMTGGNVTVSTNTQERCVGNCLLRIMLRYSQALQIKATFLNHTYPCVNGAVMLSSNTLTLVTGCTSSVR